MRLNRWLDEFRTDVRYAMRQLRAAPGFTVVATLTLALGIGANSAMFALADAALFRPLPFRDPDRLVIVDEWGPQQQARSRIELLNFREWATEGRTFESMAAVWIPGTGGGPTLTAADGTPEIIPGQSVTASFFEVLGVRAIAGRTFLPSDETPDPAVAVLSEGFWRRRFAADPTLVGREITLDGRSITVIGIVPSDVQFTPGLSFLSQGASVSSVWILLPAPRSGVAGDARGQCGVCRFLLVVGRMKAETSVDAAQSDLTLLADKLASQSGTARPRRVLVTSLRDSMIGPEVRLTSADLQIISASYFDTLDLPIDSGRAFTDDDRASTTPVCIVNEAFARRHFPGRNAVGERLRVGFDVVDREIVGVARQVKGRPDEVEEFVQIYVPLRQNAWPGAYLIARVTEGDATSLVPAVRAAIAKVDPRQAVNNVNTLEGIAGTPSDIDLELCWLGLSDRWRCCSRWRVSSVCWRTRCSSERASLECASHWAPLPSA